MNLLRKVVVRGLKAALLGGLFGLQLAIVGGQITLDAGLSELRQELAAMVEVQRAKDTIVCGRCLREVIEQPPPTPPGY